MLPNTITLTVFSNRPRVEKYGSRFGCVPGKPGCLRVRARAYQLAERRQASTWGDGSGKLGEIKQVPSQLGDDEG